MIPFKTREKGGCKDCDHDGDAHVSDDECGNCSRNMSNVSAGLPEYTDNYVHRKSEVKPAPKSMLHAVIFGQDDGFGDGESIEHKKWVQAGKPRGKADEIKRKQVESKNNGKKKAMD